MRFSKLALAAFSLALASGAAAEDPAQPVEAAQPAAQAVEEPAQPMAAPAEASAQVAGGAEASQDAPVPTTEASGAPAAEAMEGAVAPAAEATQEPAAPAAAALDDTAAAEAPAPRAIELGPVGHDAQGREGRIHVVHKGDTLWDISDAYLGTPWVWPSLWKDNDEIRNPHRIYPGDRIWISPWEMRKVSSAEADALLAGRGAEPSAPAAIAETDAMPGGPTRGSYRYLDAEDAGFVTREQYDGAASILDSPEPRKWLSEQSEVVIGLGAGEVQVGDQFDVFRTESRVTDLDTGLHYGWATKQLGWLEVTRVDEESARAVVRSSRSEMQRGDLLLPRRVRSSQIPILASPGPIEGRVVHTPDKRRQMAQVDVVYLDRGAQDGLAVGSPLEIYRSLGDDGMALDKAQKQKRRMADHVVAKLLVVDVYDETAVAVVTNTTEELNRGDHFRGSDSIQP